MVDVPGAAGARPPLPSPASAAPLRAASPGPFGSAAAGAGGPLARGLAGSGGSGTFSAGALTRQSTGGGAGVPMKPGHKKQGRFEVYEVRAPRHAAGPGLTAHLVPTGFIEALVFTLVNRFVPPSICGDSEPAGAWLTCLACTRGHATGRARSCPAPVSGRSLCPRRMRCGAARRPAPPGASKRAGRCGAQEGNAPPPLSPVVGNGAALLEAAMKPATPDAAGPRSTASMDGGTSEPASRAPSESLEAGAADKSKEAKRKGRFQARARPPRQRSEGPAWQPADHRRGAQRTVCLGGQQSFKVGCSCGLSRGRMTRRCAFGARPVSLQAARLFCLATRAGGGRRPGRGAGLSLTQHGRGSGRAPRRLLRARMTAAAAARAQIVEDDFGDSKARVGRSTSATNVGDGRPGSSAGGGEASRPGASAAALLLALKEVASGLGAQYDLMKELVHAVQARRAPPGCWPGTGPAHQLACPLPHALRGRVACIRSARGLPRFDRPESPAACAARRTPSAAGTRA